MELSCPGMRLHTIKKDLSGTQLQEQENAANYGALTTTLETSICRDADIIGQPLHGEGQESARELLETTIQSWVATGRLRLMKVQSAENVANVPTNHVTQRYFGETAICWYVPTTAQSLCWFDSGAACHVCPPSWAHRMSLEDKQFHLSTKMTDPGDAPLVEENDTDNVHGNETGNVAA